ncbi:UDP-glycosyltransferase 74F2-like [Nymphaea colorata]|uniref:Glycosyltransferase n=1 Tax=Nymphaea colorata TaxID=210225 RepID=A0A5K1B3B4_9MAGN|nr:UDP-glycosyltransferase 74F2-like [Nymphaea colorata]
MEGAAGEGKPITKPLVLLLPYTTQGHINPLNQLGQRLALHGIEVRHLTTPYLLNSLLPTADRRLSIPTELISDGFDESGYAQCGDVQTYLDRFKDVGSRTLAELLGRLASNGRPANWIVYDAFLPWVADVARRFGVSTASFFSQLGAVNATYYLHCHRKLNIPPPGSEPTTPVPIPGLPSLKFEDLSSFLIAPESIPAYYDLLLNQFSNTADVMLVNSIEELEPDVLHAMAESLPFKPVGPMLPLAHLDPRASKQRANETDLREASRADDLLGWLDSKPPRSVVYVAFGSIATLEEAQVVEIEAALRALDKPFIWVTGAKDSVAGREAAAGEVGRMVGWSSQPEVLAHAAVGCFVTHCGWNSTLEGLTLGVPMVCMPWWSDQPMNAMFVEEVWGVGLRARAGEGGTVGRKEIERCVREVMADGGEKGRRIWSRVQKWKEVIRTAADKGGSSDRNLIGFVEMVRDKH